MFKKGIFITFEGPDCAGKTTQINMLKNFLEENKYEYLVTREPGGTVIAEKLREILRETKENEIITDQAELLLMAASRAQHIKHKILPALLDDKVVICDRFFDSTTAYQGYARGIDMNFIKQLHSFVVRDSIPDLTILLDISYDKASQRMKNRTDDLDRLDKEPREFHEKVRQGFLKIAKENPQRVKVFSAEQPVEILQEQIREAVCNVLEKIQR